MSQTNKGTSGIGFTGMLAILFIGLKLAGVINWSWLWVLSPIWIPLIVVITLFSLAGLAAIISVLRSKFKH